MDIKEKIIEIIIAKSGAKGKGIDENTTLSGDLEYDSLMVFETIVEIESSFNIQFPDEYLDIDVLDRVGSIVEIVKGLMKEV